jgi:hypothetical protein
MKPISQCRPGRACIKQGEPLGRGKGEWGVRGGVSTQPTGEQSGQELAPRHKGGFPSKSEGGSEG